LEASKITCSFLFKSFLIITWGEIRAVKNQADRWHF
jgi:hypothetical protein